MNSNGSTDQGTFGLACAGGVVEGAVYEIGALRAVDEAVEGIDVHDLDVYVGVSSGGLIGALLANGVSAHELSRGVISEAHDSTLNLQPEILFRTAGWEYLRRLRGLPSALFSSLRYYTRHPRDLSLLGVLSTFGSVLPTGLFTNEPLEDFLADVLSSPSRTNDFRRLERELYIVAMHLDSADVHVFGAEGRDDVPISRAIRASTALPGLYTPVLIQGRYYIDGVARRTVHASLALEAGTDLVFCINPIVPVDLQFEGHAERPLEQASSAPSLADRGLSPVLSQTFRALVDSRKRVGFQKYEHTHPDADLLLIEPECEDTTVFFSNIFSFRNRREVCEHAYQATRRHLSERADEIEPMLARHGLTLQTDVLKEERSLYGAPAPASGDEDAQIDRTTRGSSPTDVLRQTDAVLDRVRSVLNRVRERAGSR